MAFTGDESEEITLTQAIAWTTNFRTEEPSPTTTKAHFFGRTQLMKILDQTDCAGIRAYYAIDDDDKKQLVLVGVTFEEIDMTDGVLLDKSAPCPATCDLTSVLQ